MGKDSNRQRESQLGMPFGTASARLKKNIMFSLVVRLGEDICFKCGSKILTPEELSVEHKNPWLHMDANLFWDLENIAFSHLVCNKPNNRKGPPRREVFDGNRIKCHKCKLILEFDEFHKNNSRASGLNSDCKKCRSDSSKQRKLTPRSAPIG